MRAAIAANLGTEFHRAVDRGRDGELLRAARRRLRGHRARTSPRRTSRRASAATSVMALSNKFGWLVLTTGNKSELSVGYATLYGDMAGGFAVLKDVYKGLVYRLVRWRNEVAGRELVPASVLERPPSAELRHEQRRRGLASPLRRARRDPRGLHRGGPGRGRAGGPRAAGRRRGARDRAWSTARSTSAARRRRGSRSPRGPSAATGGCRSRTATRALPARARAPSPRAQVSRRGQAARARPSSPASGAQRPSSSVKSTSQTQVVRPRWRTARVGVHGALGHGAQEGRVVRLAHGDAAVARRPARRWRPTRASRRARRRRRRARARRAGDTRSSTGTRARAVSLPASRISKPSTWSSVPLGRAGSRPPGRSPGAAYSSPSWLPSTSSPRSSAPSSSWCSGAARTTSELSEMLGMPETRVRELAREALVDLAPLSGRGVEEDWRGQLADYVLGQQSGPEATATRGHLRRSEAARTWARSLLDSLEQLYDNGSMPAIPEGSAAAALAGPTRRRRAATARRRRRDQAPARAGRWPARSPRWRCWRCWCGRSGAHRATTTAAARTRPPPAPRRQRNASRRGGGARPGQAASRAGAGHRAPAEHAQVRLPVLALQQQGQRTLAGRAGHRCEGNPGGDRATCPSGFEKYRYFDLSKEPIGGPQGALRRESCCAAPMPKLGKRRRARRSRGSARSC